MIEYDGSYVINYYFVLQVNGEQTVEGVFTAPKFLHSIDQIKDLKRELLDHEGYTKTSIHDCYFITLEKLSKVYGDGRVE